MTLDGKIKDGKILDTASAPDKVAFEAWKKENDGADIQITFETINGPEHYMYRYYWGHLLPDLADHMGVDIYYCHIFSKREKLFIPVSCYDDMKKKHLNSGIFSISQQDLHDMPDHLPYSLIKGALIVHSEVDGEQKIIGYIPSTAKKCFTFREMSAYIKRVEDIFFRDLQGSFRDHAAAIEMRIRAEYESVGDSGKLFNDA